MNRKDPAFRQWSKRVVLSLFAGCLVSLSGCQYLALYCSPNSYDEIPDVQKYSYYLPSDFAQRMPGRVVIVPTGGQQGQYQTVNRFVDELAAELRMAGLFEVIVPQRATCSNTVDGILAGRFDEQEIVELARQYHGDAVMFVRVNHFQGHAPLSASITAAMVDANDSIVLFGIDGNWDTADPEIRRAYQAVVKQRNHDLPVQAQAIHLQAPKNLFTFVAKQIASAMTP